jgi:site-specific DNA-methyltransferase (adenine-specific)
MSDPITLIHGDCLVEMKKIPDGSVDMILCDLPYGTTACKWDTVIPFELLWEQYKRISKDNAAIVLTASHPFTSALVMSNIKMFKYEWVWDKSRAVGFPNAKNKPMNKHENILVFSRGDCANRCHLRMNYNPQNLIEVNKKVNGIKSCNADAGGHGFARPSHKSERIQQYTNFPNSVLSIPNEGNTVHPTQKPVALMEYLIKTYTNEGDTVLDNCMGSGTTGVACKNLNRRFIGIEKDEKYFEIAKGRLS